MDDEIDLRAYAEAVWRARRVVAGVTLAATLVAFAVSRLVLPKVYEASALSVVEAPEGQKYDTVRAAFDVYLGALTPSFVRGGSSAARAGTFQTIPQHGHGKAFWA